MHRVAKGDSNHCPGKTGGPFSIGADYPRSSEGAGVEGELLAHFSRGQSARPEQNLEHDQRTFRENAISRSLPALDCGASSARAQEHWGKLSICGRESLISSMKTNTPKNDPGRTES